MEVAVELATILHANQHVAAAVRRKDRESLYHDFASHYEATVKIKALELAANFRVLDDRLKRSEEYRLLRRHLEKTHSVGVWIDPFPGDLPLREVANKILHVDEVCFRRIRFKTSDTEGVEPFVNWCDDWKASLKGRRGSVDWSCEVDFLAFAVCVHALMTYWMEDATLGSRMQKP